MLRKTIFKIRKAGACPIPNSWRGLADDKSKNETFTEQQVRWKGSDARGTPPDELPVKRNNGRICGFKNDEIMNKLYTKKDKETPAASKDCASKQVCQRKISEIFGEIDGGKAKNDTTNIPKSSEDFNLKCMSKSCDDEAKLTQRIEKIKEENEVPIVEAQHIEEFGTTPKTLNTIVYDYKLGYTNIDKALDDLASQCLHAAPTQIDDNLLSSINKLLYKSVDPLTSDPEPEQVKPKAGTIPSPKLKKKSKVPPVEDATPNHPTLKDDTIPHPGTFLFTHVNYGVLYDSKIVDSIISSNQGSSGQMKTDLASNPGTYLFDNNYYGVDGKHDHESYLQFDYDSKANNKEICEDQEAIDFWEGSDSQQTPDNRKKICDNIASKAYESTDSKGSSFLDVNQCGCARCHERKMQLTQPGNYIIRQRGRDEIPPASATLVNSNGFNRASVNHFNNDSPDILHEKLKDGKINFSYYLAKSAATLEDISMLHEIRKKGTDEENDTPLNIGCHYLSEELGNEKQNTSECNTPLIADLIDQSQTILADLSIPHPCAFLFGTDSFGKNPEKPNSEWASSQFSKLPKANDIASSTKVKDTVLRNPCTYLFGCNVPSYAKNNLERYSPFTKSVHQNAWIFDKVRSYKGHEYEKNFTSQLPNYDSTKKPQKSPPISPSLRQKGNDLERFAIKHPKSRILNSVSTVQPNINAIIEESKKPNTVIMQETNVPKKVREKVTDQKEHLMKSTASLPSSLNTLRSTAKSNVWGEIVNSKDLPKRYRENYPHLGSPSSQALQSNKIDESTFEPPSVVFETEPYSKVKQMASQPTHHVSINQASKALIVSSEFDENSKLLGADSIKKDIKMPLPKGKLESSSQTLVFTRDDLVNKTNLQIHIDNISSPLSKEFDKAKEITIKLSDQDLSKNKVLSNNGLIIHELEIITQDETKNLPVSKKYVSKSHPLQLDGATSPLKLTKDELMKMKGIEMDTTKQINNLEEHVQRLDHIVNTLMERAGTGNKSNMKLLMQKLQEKRKLENYLQHIYEHLIKFAECRKRNRPKCPPVLCPPKPRCTRKKKQKRLNRSSCKSNDCTTTKCDKRTTCKSKSKSFVCDHSPPKPKGPCDKCVAIESGNEMVLNQLLPDEYLMEPFNIPTFRKSLRDQLPIFTGSTTVSPNDEELFSLLRRNSFVSFWNYKNFDPWVPIPSYEKSKEDKKRFKKSPKSPCKELLPPVNPNINKSKAFPRQLLSVPNFLFVTKK